MEFLIVVEILECQGPDGPIIEELEDEETAVIELFEAFIDGEFIKTIPEEEAMELEEEAAEEATAVGVVVVVTTTPFFINYINIGTSQKSNSNIGKIFRITGL